MAIINALSWDLNGKDNAIIYRKYLEGKYNIPNESFIYEKINDEESKIFNYDEDSSS